MKTYKLVAMLLLHKLLYSYLLWDYELKCSEIFRGLPLRLREKNERKPILETSPTGLGADLKPRSQDPRVKPTDIKLDDTTTLYINYIKDYFAQSYKQSDCSNSSRRSLRSDSFDKFDKDYQQRGKLKSSRAASELVV